MYNIDIICVGKLKEDYLRGACAEYSKRLSAFCKLKITELTPARIPDDPSKAQIDSALADEGKRILQLIHQSARVYAMCIEGKQLSSEELSRDIEQAAVGGSGNLVFIIGGSHGLTDEVKRRANFKLSMSKMTFPHQLRTCDAARTNLPRVHDIERREISQIKMRNCGNSCSSVFAISKDRRIL